ncbi:hypothetical protein XA68_15617 [Ophiocordyceps unilateralis]|uniref:FAD-binding PCMH-type domain-containing protein n=1 Tax=Ophiocordyceps unilateralis TaxID=268505 RepID=A0A2A9P7P8_OPHUN|nr:hypothetical protein XA68_15617 [Ophiocordyceps unilateralis]
MYLLSVLLSLYGFVAEATTLLSRASSSLPPDVENVCHLILSKYPSFLVWDPTGPWGFRTASQASMYNEAVTSYLSVASISQRPACILFPSNAAQVSYAVRLLNSHPGVRFGLKSGGHNGNLGFSTAPGGLLIAFRPNSRFAVPAPNGRSVLVGAGCKWKDVYEVLQPLGKAAVGARFDDVGVTGYILGGGLSYLSAQYGFACDNVLSFKCVLANGTIVTASRKSHPDLYFALRGGGNQFAIVTSMRLRTHHVGRRGLIWGGMRIYAATQHDALLDAIAKFTAEGNDPKAAIFPVFGFGTDKQANFPLTIVVYFYDGLKPSSVFDGFDRIPSLFSDTGPTAFRKLHEQLDGGNIQGIHVAHRMNSFPNMPPAVMSDFLREHYTKLQTYADTASTVKLIEMKVFSFDAQPIHHTIAQASKRIGGGNALNLDPSHGDRLWIAYYLAWTNSSCDEACPKFLQSVSNAMRKFHKEHYAGVLPTHYAQGDLDFLSYNPIYMNHAMHDQKVLQSYGNATYQRLKAIHAAYDPHGLFSQRQGGFHFTD